MQRIKLVVRMPCLHNVLPSVEVFLNLGPHALEMLRAPRYLNPALTRDWTECQDIFNH